jgi:formate hydrogenlyase subunit 3/multisubunit Na+/H+ antiporter MnhD subunit
MKNEVTYGPFCDMGYKEIQQQTLHEITYPALIHALSPTLMTTGIIIILCILNRQRRWYWDAILFFAGAGMIIAGILVAIFQKKIIALL